MISVCAWCKKVMGEVAPLTSNAETHGICAPCTKKHFSELKGVKPMKNSRRKAAGVLIAERKYSGGVSVKVIQSSAKRYTVVLGDASKSSLQHRNQVHGVYNSLDKAMELADFLESNMLGHLSRLNPGAAYHEGEAIQEEQTEQRARRTGKTTQAAFHRGKAVAHRQSESKARSLGMNPGSRINAKVEGVVYNRIIEIKAEKTLPHSRGLWKHPFNKNSAAQILALDNGDLLIHSTAGKRLWKPF